MPQYECVVLIKKNGNYLAMQESLKIALVQTHLVWEAPEQNFTRMEGLVLNGEQADIFVLPEMFNTGFTMNAEPYAETMDGATVANMVSLAAKKGAVICGSIIIKEGAAYYNRFVWVTPEGHILHYNKRHTFTLAGEEKVFTRGERKVLIEYKGWKICPQVCYDLRFPVWARNTEDYDLLLYVANWPVMRIAAWDVLLKARAIENMCYVIGVNRVGEDGNGIPYNGHSAIVGPLGNAITEAGTNAYIVYGTVWHNTLTQVREKFRFLNDRDYFTLLGVHS